MANRIDKLKSKSTEIVDEKKYLTKESEELKFDKSTVSELLATIGDERDIDIVQKHHQILENDISVNEEKITINKETTNETLTETNEYLSGLEENLFKLEQMKETSDLVKNSTGEVSTKRRIAELESIKSLLGEESGLKEWKGDFSGVLDSDTSTGLLKENVIDKNINIEKYDNTPLKQNSLIASSEQWASTLTNEEFDAIRAYTFTEYKNINEKLRGKTLFFSKGNKENAMNLHNALQRARVPTSCTVYRGASKAALGKYASLSDDELVGKHILDKGFMSTSLRSECAFGGDLLLEIQVEENAKGAYVSHGNLSAVGNSECELLFDKGRMLKITSVSYDFFGKRIIKAKML